MNNISTIYRWTDHVTQTLVIIGAINWGMVGLLEIDLVALVFQDPILIRSIYTIVGIAGIIQIYQRFLVSPNTIESI